MRISKIHVENFRCLKDTVVEVDDMTALIGPNGSGKSSVMEALNLFYETNASYSEADFFDRDTDRDIIVQVTFNDLGPIAKDQFSQYIAGETLTVEKVMSYPGHASDQTYHGNRPVNPDFDDFREASGRWGYQDAYEEIQEDYPSLPEYTNRDDGEEALQEWEENNPEECERRREETQFFGYSDVGRAGLEEYTKFIPIPAVREASEETDDQRDSGLKELMDMAVRAALSEKEEIEGLKEETEKEFERIIVDESKSNLEELEEALSNRIGTFAPGVGVQIDWVTEGLVDIQMPDANIDLVEDDFASKVGNAGHGSQRALIITLLQELTIRGEEKERGEGEGDEETDVSPNYLLAIEEPELYQHPDRQRHLRSILANFEDQEIAGAAKSVQVMYSTHSPLMVGIEDFDDIRSLEKTTSDPALPKHTSIRRSSLKDLAREAEEIEEVDEGTFSPDSVRARLEAIMTPWINEGFFADNVILVEGLQDRAALVGYAENRGMDLSSDGIAILPCNGKTKLGWPAIIFNHLGKSVYGVFDSDKETALRKGEEESKIEQNHRLQRLFGAEEITDWPDRVEDTFASFQEDLNTTLGESLGEDNYRDYLEAACDRYGYPETSRGEKNPVVMAEVFSLAEEDDLEVGPFEEIIERGMPS